MLLEILLVAVAVYLLAPLFNKQAPATERKSLPEFKAPVPPPVSHEEAINCWASVRRRLGPDLSPEVTQALHVINLSLLSRSDS
jgi:hypothetical protein